jgi:RNA polymerase sigma-70 factor (ECF subfamily)
MADNNDETAQLLRRAGEGDPDAPGQLFAQHRVRLRHMIRLRLDTRIQGRVDASDVLQETYLEFSRSLADYLRDPAMPFYLWLRTVAGRKLNALHRHHLGAEMRAAGREVSIYRGDMSEASSASLADRLLGAYTSPSQAAMKAELQITIQTVLNGMDPLDREVLTLRHFERLNNAETARILELTEAAASKRFVRALKRLKQTLTEIPSLIDEPPQPSDEEWETPTEAAARDRRVATPDPVDPIFVEIAKRRANIQILSLMRLLSRLRKRV